MTTHAAVDWSKIDTVLLDMDGTLLDLRFDNWFWEELIPDRYALQHGMSPEQAWEVIRAKFSAVRGTIAWYCIDHWARELCLDVAGMKRSALGQVSYLPGAEDFLRRLGASGKRRVLVTNAHPTSLALKNERLDLVAHFDACYSTHAFTLPKENAAFWPLLQVTEGFDPARTLFVDDSVAVLDAATRFGIGWVRAIRRPDSGRPSQATGQHVAVDRVADLL